MKTVGVIGAGNWGTTVSHLIGNAGHKVVLWCRNEMIASEINDKKTNSKYTAKLKISENVSVTNDLKKVATQCELIFVAIPSKAFRKTAFQLGAWVRGDQILVSCTKGIEKISYRTMSDILKEETCCKKVGVLSGPNIAADIINGDPSGTVIASHYDEVIEKVIEALQQPLFKVYGNRDVRGTEYGGALKNIIAIASGIATGLSLSHNAKAFLITRGVVEISRYGKFFGANPKTFFGLSGIGDLMATCYSPNSRNNSFGRLIAEGKTKDEILNEMSMVVEGVYTTDAVYALSKKFNIPMPITASIYHILYKQTKVKDEIKKLMDVRNTFEDEGGRDEYSEITHALIHKYPIPEYLL